MQKLNEVCRAYRIAVGATLADIAAHDEQNGNIKSLSAFEHGNSSNMRHIYSYRNHASKTGNMSTYKRLMIEAING